MQVAIIFSIKILEVTLVRKTFTKVILRKIATKHANIARRTRLDFSKTLYFARNLHLYSTILGIIWESSVKASNLKIRYSLVCPLILVS